MRNERGQSLLSIMIASAISIILLLAGFRALQDMQTNLAFATKRAAEHDDYALVRGFLEKAFSRSDYHIFSFTNDQANQVYRSLMPAPGYCADLSGCPEQVAFLFSFFDDKTTAMGTAVCAISTAPNVTILFDTQADPLTSVAPSGQGFNVTSAGPFAASGKIDMTPGSLITLADLPQGSLWTVLAPPSVFNFTYTAATQGFNSAEMQSNPDCSKTIDLTVDGSYTNRFYKVQIRPVQLQNFFNPAALPAATNGLGQFPIRVFNSQFVSVGYLPASASEPSKLSVRDCTLQNTSLVCNNERLKIPNVSKVRVGMSFYNPIGNGAQPDIWDIRSTAPACEGVLLGTCQALSMAPYTFKSMYPGETFDNLSSAGFSLMKTEKTSGISIRFLVTKEKKNDAQQVPDRTVWESIDAKVP